MTKKILKNKPIIEAIFEMRWELLEPESGVKIDPYFKLLIGRLYDKIFKEYSFHEQLPTASVPDHIAGYVVQHRFRKEKNGWPLVQIGPGIISVNDTVGYIWDDFEGRIEKTVKALFSVYPESEKNLRVNRVMLRYIDAINFNFDQEDIFMFLKEEMKTEITLYSKLFDGTRVTRPPLDFDLKFLFNSSEPKGAIHIKFYRGEIKGVDSLLWETIVESAKDDAPKNKNEIFDWVKLAHDLTDDWFFKLIEGELERRFE